MQRIDPTKPAVLSPMQRKTPPPRAHVRAVGWQSAHVDGRGESSKMHRHCVFKDRGPNCSARKLKRRSIVMLATSCWRPQAYASARGCVMQKPLVTALRFSVLLLARNSIGLICHGRPPSSVVPFFLHIGFVAEG